jgi:O-methyltransferase involved in polyketide biosynthesis
MEIDATFFISYVDPLIHEKPENCFGVNYHNPKQKAETIMRLAAKVGEPWISFYSAKEMENLLLAHGFTLTANKTLADLNKEYFTPVGRTLPEHHILKLEHFVIAESKK